jgi:hypothetical protein
MSVKDELDQFNVPEIADANSILGAARSAKSNPNVKIGGILIGKNAVHIFVKTCGSLYQIAVDAIISVDKDESQPSRDQLGDGVAILITVSPETEIIERRSFRANALNATVGIRPLSYALPSDTERFKVVHTGAPLDAAYGSEYKSPYQTPNPTSSHTPYTSTYTTHIGGDHTDTETDWRADIDNDYTTDYMQDHD